jgi:hypothetical protein
VTPAGRVLASYAEHAAREAARMEAYCDLEKAIAEYRAANPAPAGKWWCEVKGKMVLRDVPTECGHVYDGDEVCEGDAVEWDDNGGAWCRIHKGER